MKRFSVFGFAVIFFSLGFVKSELEGYRLSLDDPKEDVFKVKTSQFDNVTYRHYTPQKHKYAVTVFESENKVWESDGFGTCVYALLAYRKQLPYLLYLQVDSGHTLFNLYYVKEENQWKKIDIVDYCNLLKDVKNEVRVNGIFGYNLFNAVNNSMISVENESEDAPYTQFTSSIGYFASHVYFKNQKLWNSKNEGERCAAAFCYSHLDEYYMIRLLVTNADEESKLETYFKIKNKWVHVHTLDEVHDKKLYVQKPESFKYPNYTFTCKPFSVSKVETFPMEVRGSDNLTEPYFDLSDEFYKYKVQHQDTDNTFGFHDRVHSYDYVDYVESACQEPYYDLTDEFYKFKLQTQDTDDTVDNKDLSTKLDISLTAINLFTHLRCVDNVFYKLYNPTSDTLVRTVVDCKTEVWKAKSESERCVHVMAPQKEGQHVALYVLLEVGSELKSLFFEKVDGKWKRTNLEQYKNTIDNLKRNIVNDNITIDLGSKIESSLYSVEYKLGKNPCILYLPRFGTTCHRVVDGVETIWEPSHPLARCVAVWAYDSWGKSYMVKVLVQLTDGTCDVLSYINVKNQWDLFSSFKRSFANKMPFKKPIDFYNPEYLFNQDIRPYHPHTHTTSTSEEKTSETSAKVSETDYVNKELSESFDNLSLHSDELTHTDSVDDYLNDPYNNYLYSDDKKDYENKFVTEASDPKFSVPNLTERAVQNAVVNKICSRKSVSQKYKIYYRPISANDCVRLDLSSPMNMNSCEVVRAKFDGKLSLITFRALPGKYFNVVYEGNNVIFHGDHTTHVCYEFNVYLKNNAFYLADVLARVKNEDVTLHLRKIKDNWEYIDQETFLNSVNVLKVSQAPFKFNEAR